MTRCVVLGGGIAGLAAAYRLRQASEGRLSVRLVEASPRLGGKVLSERQRGFLLEGGPDSFVAHKPAALDLVRELGLEHRLVPSNDDFGGASIFHNGRLCPLPEGFRYLVPGRWGPFFRSSLLSWRGKLRLACEPWIPKGPSQGDESVADFVRRRLGQEALERIAEPMLAHIHVADIERMSLLATYPRLRAMEQRHGSVWKAFQAAGPPRGPLFWTLKGGIAELTEALAGRLPEEHLISGRPALGVSAATDGTWQVHLQDQVLAADYLVLAMPAYAAAAIMNDLVPDLAQSLGLIRYVSLATLSLGFDHREVAEHPPGFGFFVPRKEQNEVLAATWSSVKFAERAPSNDLLLRLFLADGGDGESTLSKLSDTALIEAVRVDLKRLTGVRAEPVLQRLFRWPKGYPQYDVGHGDTLRKIDKQLPEKIFLAGSAFHGVGLPDCIQSGFAAATAILEARS